MNKTFRRPDFSLVHATLSHTKPTSTHTLLKLTALKRNIKFADGGAKSTKQLDLIIGKNVVPTDAHANSSNFRLRRAFRGTEGSLDAVSSVLDTAATKTNRRKVYMPSAEGFVHMVTALSLHIQNFPPNACKPSADWFWLQQYRELIKLHLTCPQLPEKLAAIES